MKKVFQLPCIGVGTDSASAVFLQVTTGESCSLFVILSQGLLNSLVPREQRPRPIPPHQLPTAHGDETVEAGNQAGRAKDDGPFGKIACRMTCLNSQFGVDHACRCVPRVRSPSVSLGAARCKSGHRICHDDIKDNLELWECMDCDEILLADLSYMLRVTSSSRKIFSIPATTCRGPVVRERHGLQARRRTS